MSAEPARVRALSYDGHMNSVRVQAPAKVNLFLGVGEVLADGYHAVTTVMHAIDLRDEVVLAPAGVLSLVCVPDVGVPAERNLAWRAATEMGSRFGRDPRVEITLTKHTPHGAGLGGGSSDAAAVIAGLAYLWGADRRDDRCIGAARALGADVAFFLGEDGRGDVLRATEHLLLRLYGAALQPRSLRLTCEGFRARRDEALAVEAHRLAEAVRNEGQPRTLEPMNAYERRVVHVALQAEPGITTYSVGQGSDRRVTVAPAGTEGPVAEARDGDE